MYLRPFGLGLSRLPCAAGAVLAGTGWLLPGAGISPRRASHFLSSRRKKVTKERATLLCVSLRCATGNLRCSRAKGCRRTHCAASQLRSDNCGKSELEACVSCGTHAPFTRCASRHAQKGTRMPDPGRRCARPGAQRAARALGAERSDGPNRPPRPSVRAEKRRAAGACVCRRTHALRALTCRSCLNGAHAVRAVSSAAAPADRASQVAPQRSGGDAHSRVALSLVTFFRRDERKLLARRGEIPAPGSKDSAPASTAANSAPRL